MTSPEKGQLDFPVSERPSTKARPTRPSMPVPQTPDSPSPPPVPPSNHLGGDDQLAFSPLPVVQTTKPEKKPDTKPQEDDEDAGDPDAQPSGHPLPFAEGDEPPVSPQEEHAASDIPDEEFVDVEEGEEEDNDDSDATIDYHDLFVDEGSWSYLGCQPNRSFAAILVRSLSPDTSMVRLLTLSLYRPTLTLSHRLRTLQRRNVSQFVRTTRISRKSTPALRRKTEPS